MFFTTCVLFTALISYFAVEVACNTPKRPVLDLVHVFFRHGSRTPEKSEIYPTDPHAVGEFYPFGYGQLTNIGKRGAHQLGKLLRERYANFLGEIYTPELVSTKTTEYVRTQMSALLVLAGLFPPSNVQKWNNDLNWMPIPYSYDNQAQDYELRRAPLYCPALHFEIEKTLKSESVKKLIADHQEDFKYISQHSGKNMTQLIDAFFLYQTLYAEDQMNLTLPNWTKTVYLTKLHDLAVELLNYENVSPLLKRLNGGRMFKKVLENMIAKSKGLLKPEGKKIFLYSGHEVNVVTILTFLHLFDNKFPDYSSAVMIELYYDATSNEYTVKVVYARNAYKQPEELVIPGCTKFCPLTQLVENLKQYLPNNYTEECGSSVLLD